MAIDPPNSAAGDVAGFGDLPETIGQDNLNKLNQALEALFGVLRDARRHQEGSHNGRAAAVVALRAVSFFLMRFQPALAETLHMPLLNLMGALLALNNNNVEPILKPTKQSGRAVSSPGRFTLIGIAVGTASRLEWTGMSPQAANKGVAAKLVALGIKPARGKGGIIARTLRGWRERVDRARPLLGIPLLSVDQVMSAEDQGWVNAVEEADLMLTDKWRSRIGNLAPTTARKFILDALENSIHQMNLG
jgi:hypothetical protein